jgi:hypothetical protein
MNLKTTVVLILLAGGCAVLYWKGPDWAPSLGLAPKAAPTSDTGAANVLASLPVDEIEKIEVDVPGQPKLVLQAPKPGQPLELPGNWPIRRAEVEELTNTLHDLKTRYYPIAIDDKTDLTPYGLSEAQKPIRVTIKMKSGTQKLDFGEAPLQPGDNPFTRATYVRPEGKNEVLRLGPQVLPILRRTEETYRRRQLFPEAMRARVQEPKRARIPGMEEPERTPAPTFLLSDAAVKISTAMPSGQFVLERVAPNPEPEPPPDKPDDDAVIQPVKLAESWVLAAPTRDRIDPDKARAILTAIPNLWLEKFVESKPGAAGFFGLGPHPNLTPELLTLLGGSIPGGPSDTPLRAALNFVCLGDAKSPTASLTVTLKDGSERTLQIGRVARTIGGDDLRYAKIDKNPLIFELKGDKLNDLQISLAKPSSGSPTSPADDLRDPVLVRFDEAKVNGIEISSKDEPKGKSIKLEKDGDDWKMLSPVADPANKQEVNELLTMLKGMEARKGSIVDGKLQLPLWLLGGAGSIDPKLALGLTPDREKKITLTFDAKSGRQPVTFLVGLRDASTKKRPVMVEGWPRINVVDDPAEGAHVSKLERQPSSYRAFKLFDSGSKISEVVVERSADDAHAADGYTVKEQEGLPPKWAITAPFKAETDLNAANALVGEVSGLGSPKYVFDPSIDAPSKLHWPEFLTGLGIAAPSGDAQFGLSPPALTITLKFSEPKGAPDKTIEIGRARSDTEYYARLKGTTGVFLVSDRVVKAIDHKPVDFVDKALIKADVQTIRRSMNGQELELTQNTALQWDITKPYMAKADQANAEQLAQALGDLRASRIEAVSPKDLKPFGLDPPVATITVEALEKNKIVEKTLLIGNPVNAGDANGERFVKAQGSTTVGVIPGSLAQKFVAPSQQFRDLTLGGFVSADKIVMERGDRKITLVKGPTGWRVKEPLDADAEDGDLRELHDRLARLRADEMIENPSKDLAVYGLDKPAHWHIFNGDREVLHLLVGAREKTGPDKKMEGERSYAMVDKGKNVALLDVLTSQELSEEYRKRALWELVPAKDVKEVTLKAPNAKDSFTFVNEGAAGWKDAQAPTEKLDPARVAPLVRILGSLRAERYVVDKGADLTKFGLDKPRVFTLTLNDGKKLAVLLGNLDGERYYAKVDDPARTDVFLLPVFASTALKQNRAEYRLIEKDAPKEPKKEAPKEPKKEDPFKKAPDMKKP